MGRIRNTATIKNSIEKKKFALEKIERDDCSVDDDAYNSWIAPAFGWWFDPENKEFPWQRGWEESCARADNAFSPYDPGNCSWMESVVQRPEKVGDK